MKGSTASALAITAVVLTAGIWSYDIARNKKAATQQWKLQTFLGLGLGGVILIALAEFLPALGGPLALLFITAVLVGRPGAVNYIAKLTAASAGTGG